MENSKDFFIGDLVWAKMKGYPPWPARIVEPLNEVSKPRKGQHFVYFFGSSNHAWIHDEKIFPHSDHMIETANKYKSAAFRNAIELITYYNKNNINKNKRIYSKFLKSKKGKTSAVNGNKILSKTKSVKCTVSNAKIPERRHFKTQNKNPVAVKALRKPFKSPLHVDGIEDVILTSEKTQNAKKEDKTFKSLENENASAVEVLKKPFKGSFETIGVRDIRLSSATKSPETSDHSKHSCLTPEVSTSQTTVSLDNDDLSAKKRKIQKHKGEVIIEEPVIEPLDSNTASVSLKELNIKSDKKIGFLGLGQMGSCFVKKFLDSGHQVSVYNRTHEKCDYFVEAGAHKFLTPADLVAHSDIIFCCVSGPDATKALVFGEFGVLAGLRKNGERKGYIEMTTLDPDTVIECSSVIAETGARYLEAPFHGSRMQADKGTLLVFAAGDHSLFLDCETYFQAIASRAIYINCTSGSASKINLVLNMSQSAIKASLKKVLPIVDQAGFGSEFINILKSRFKNLAIIESLDSIDQQNFVPKTPFKHMQNAMALFTEMAMDMKSSFPLAFETNEMLKYALANFSEIKDNSYVYQLLRNLRQ